MSKPLLGTKIALLVANGFNQQDFTDIQRALTLAGGSLKIISPDQGLVNGWEGTGWGHHFPIDQQLSTALGADFDMLVVPGGQRGLDKLKTTAHTKRFVNSFMMGNKPVAMVGNAVDLLVFAEQISGRVVAAPDALKDAVTNAGGTVSASPAVDGMLYTGTVDQPEERSAFFAGMAEFFVSHAADVKQAA